MWVEPKTDWAAGDTVNIDPDWNRITGNIRALAQEAKPVAGILALRNMPELEVSDYPYADVLNRVELNYDKLVRAIYPTGEFQPRRDVQPLEKPWNEADLNRIEGLMLETRPVIEKAMKSRATLSFMMGGGYFATCV